MSLKLYEIASTYEQLLTNTFDPETGEVNQQALDELALTKEAAREKAIAVAAYIKNLDAERKAIDEARANMAEREERLKTRVAFLTTYLQSNMERCGISEITSPYFTIKLKKCPVSVNITNEFDIPDEFIKRKEVTSIDKVKLKEQLQAGAVITGAELKQNNRIEIK